MSEFFTVVMDGTSGEPVKITIRRSKVDSVQQNGRTISVLLSGQTPINFIAKNYVEAEKLYDQISSEMEPDTQ